MRLIAQSCFAAVFQLIIASVPVEAQQPAKVVRIGMALGGTPEALKYRVEGFLQGMRELGYNEGRNLHIEYRYTGGDPGRRLAVADEVVRLQPHVIVASSTGLVDSLRKATSTIPIVVGNAGDLVGTGVVASLSRPGGNVTGTTDMAADLAPKRLELIREFVPRLKRVGVIVYDVSGYSDGTELKELEAAGRRLGISVQPVPLRDVKDFQSVYSSLSATHTNAVIIIQGTFTFQHNKQLSELAVQSQLPAVCEESVWAENGCLISYGPDKAYSFRRSAVFVDKILKGAKPADLPVEQPTRFQLVVNKRTAKILGLVIPPTIEVRADRVIE